MVRRNGVAQQEELERNSEFKDAVDSCKYLGRWFSKDEFFEE